MDLQGLARPALPASSAGVHAALWQQLAAICLLACNLQIAVAIGLLLHHTSVSDDVTCICPALRVPLAILHPHVAEAPKLALSVPDAMVYIMS